MAVAQMTREDENFLNRYELEGNVLINLRPAMLKMLMCKFLGTIPDWRSRLMCKFCLKPVYSVFSVHNFYKIPGKPRRNMF